MLCKVGKMNWEFILTPINMGTAGKGENRDVKGLGSHGCVFPSKGSCVSRLTRVEAGERQSLLCLK